MSYDVELQYAVEGESIPDEATFNTWVANALKGQRNSAELCIRIVDPAESQQLNHEYRGKDKPTNVLSFPFEAPPGLQLPILGDLVICADVVAREAAEQNKLPEHHWAHMVTHGVLHLLGYDHINDEDAEIMEQLERDLLAQLEIPDPYTEI